MSDNFSADFVSQIRVFAWTNEKKLLDPPTQLVISEQTHIYQDKAGSLQPPHQIQTIFPPSALKCNKMKIKFEIKTRLLAVIRVCSTNKILFAVTELCWGKFFKYCVRKKIFFFLVNLL